MEPMRSFAFVFVMFAAACGGGMTPGNNGDDDPVVDAPPGTDPDAPPVDPPVNGFQVVSPFIPVGPGVEITYCYYFKTPNTVPMAIKRWESDMTPGSHHMIMYTSQTELKPAGTVSTSNCGLGASGTTQQPVWTYSAQTAQASIDLPADDGNGKAVAQEIQAGQPAFFQMHYFNPSDQEIQVRVTLNAYALDDGTPYVKTAPFITYYSNIEIPRMAVNHVEPANLTETSCNVPAGSKFWLMGTHAHKQAVRTRVYDGPNPSAMVFESMDWEHPTPRQWQSAPFFEFSSGKLTYECMYTNLGENQNDIVYDGDSAADDEMCMAAGYFFPATGPKICFNNFTF